MPRQTRHSTDFSGVYFVELANENKSFFIRYKRNGKSMKKRQDAVMRDGTQKKLGTYGLKGCPKSSLILQLLRIEVT